MKVPASVNNKYYQMYVAAALGTFAGRRTWLRVLQVANEREQSEPGSSKNLARIWESRVSSIGLATVVAQTGSTYRDGSAEEQRFSAEDLREYRKMERNIWAYYMSCNIWSGKQGGQFDPLLTRE